MQLTETGYFSKPHGVKGLLVLKTELDFSPQDVKVLFIDVNGSKAPYFITQLKESLNAFIVGLETVDTVEKARQLVGKKVYIESRFIEEAEEEESWLGFELIDRHYGSLGQVEEVADNGQQLLLSFTFKGRQVMLPMVDAFIEKTDEAEKKIWYNAPEGLIDLYLGESD